VIGALSKGAVPFAVGPSFVRRVEGRMRFRELAEISDALAATRSRGDKISILGTALRRLDAHGRRPAAAWLAGALPGGRRGIGYATIRELRDVPPADHWKLTVADRGWARDLVRAEAGERSADRWRRMLA